MSHPVQNMDNKRVKLGFVENQVDRNRGVFTSTSCGCWGEEHGILLGSLFKGREESPWRKKEASMGSSLQQPKPPLLSLTSVDRMGGDQSIQGLSFVPAIPCSPCPATGEKYTPTNGVHILCLSLFLCLEGTVPLLHPCSHKIDLLLGSLAVCVCVSVM